MARDYDPYRIARPNVHLLLMLIFVVLCGFLGYIMQAPLLEAFGSNPFLNSLIIGVLGFGVLFTFIQVLRLYPEIKWVNTFRAADPGISVQTKPRMLAPMATLMNDAATKGGISTPTLRSILDSIGMRLDEQREISRYLIGLLVFLGLLGTFWGLLQTIGSVGDTIRNLNVGSGSTSGLIFEELKTGLEAPLSGMGTAFSSSLFGLSGSLILGFLDLQSGQSQNRFYTELEDWLTTFTDASGDGSSVTSGSPEDLHRAIGKLTRAVDAMKRSGGGEGDNQQTAHAISNLADGIQSLVGHMRSEQQLVRDWMEAQSDQQEEVKTLLQVLTQAARKS